MKLFMQKIAQAGIVFALAFGSFFQVSADAERGHHKQGCDCAGILPGWAVKEGIIPHSVSRSAMAWRINSVYFKDSIEATSKGSTEDELRQILDYVRFNAAEIADILIQYGHDRHGHRVEAANNVRDILIEQALTLIAYVVALQDQGPLVPVLESYLISQNDALGDNLLIAVSADKNEARELREQLSVRIAFLIAEAQTFVEADSSGDYREAYDVFHETLFVGGEIGRTVGWALFEKH